MEAIMETVDIEHKEAEEKNTVSAEEVKEVIEEAVKKAVEEAIERPYELRKMQDADLFPLLQLLRKLGFKEVKDTYNKYKGSVKFNRADYETDEEAKKALDELQKQMGIDMVFELAEFMISKIDTHSDSIYEFFSMLAGVPADDIKKMEFGTLPLMIYDCVSEVKNTAFFKVLSGLL